MNIWKNNYTYMSLMNLYLMLCNQFEFNLSDAEVEGEILATICNLLCNGRNLVFWGGGNLTLHLRFWKLCMKWLPTMIHISVIEGYVESLVPNLVTLNDIFVHLGVNPRTSLCKIDVIFPISSYKIVQIYQVSSKMWVRYYKYRWQKHSYVI